MAEKGDEDIRMLLAKFYESKKEIPNIVGKQ
jgi:hypothetical protein